MPQEKRPPQLNINPGQELFDRLSLWAIGRDMSLPELSRRILGDNVQLAFEQDPHLEVAYQALIKSRAGLPVSLET